MAKTTLLIIILESLGLDGLIKFFIPEVQFIIWISLAVFFVFKFYNRVSKKEEMEKLRKMVNNDKLASVFGVINGGILLILGCTYLAFDAIDSKITSVIKNFLMESSTMNIVIGIAILTCVYYVIKFNSDEAIRQIQEEGLHEGTFKKAIYEKAANDIKAGQSKRIFVIIVGIIFGIGFILNGLSK